MSINCTSSSLVTVNATFLVFALIYLLPWWLSSKGSCNAGAAGDMGSIPVSGRSPVGGHGNPLQYSCLENPMDRGAWRATVHGVAKSDTSEAT